MSIRVNDVPDIPIGYDITGKKIMVHDMSAPLSSNTNLIPVVDLISYIGLPVQTGNSGKYLMTNGTVTSWNTISLPTNNQLLPTQTGNNGKYLLTNGSNASWATVSFPLQNINLLLPTQTSNGGKYLTTDGSVASWGTFPGLSDGSKIDILVSSNGAIWTIRPNAVTLAKIQTINANRLLGNATTSSAIPQEILIGAGLSFRNANELYVPNNSTIQKTEYYVNSTLVSTRKGLNFNISGITYSFSDDTINDRFNLNLSNVATTIEILKNNTTVASSGKINFIEGSNTTLNVINNLAQSRIDVTVTSAGSTSIITKDTFTVDGTGDQDYTVPAGYLLHSIIIMPTSDCNPYCSYTAGTTGDIVAQDLITPVSVPAGSFWTLDILAITNQNITVSSMAVGSIVTFIKIQIV